jgi:mannan endo-1,4-beta-mannosidase
MTPFRRLVPCVRALAILALSGAAVHAASDVPADPQASPAARRILAYIAGLRGKGDHRVLTGQFLDYSPNATLALPEAIHAASGKWPAYVGVDYMNYAKNALDTAAPNRTAIAYWRAGGLVELNVCLKDPANPSGWGTLFDQGVDLKPLLAEAGPVHKAWMEELDTIAGGLSELQAAGVVVLWRPFMEMNGKWFWWGGHPPDDFTALWRQVFDYFTRVKGLHNLIWVYSPNMGATAAAYYPGDAFVDLVGIDVYTDNLDPTHVQGFESLLKRGKPAGFGEFGPHGSSNPPGDFDYARLAAALRSHFPEAVFVMSWNDKWSPAKNPDARGFYTDPSVVTRDDLPAELTR